MTSVGDSLLIVDAKEGELFDVENSMDEEISTEGAESVDSSEVSERNEVFESTEWYKQDENNVDEEEDGDENSVNMSSNTDVQEIEYDNAKLTNSEIEEGYAFSNGGITYKLIKKVNTGVGITGNVSVCGCAYDKIDLDIPQLANDEDNHTFTVTEIAENAFSKIHSNDYRLERVSIPPSVQRIGDRAFWGCKYLCDVSFRGDVINQTEITDCINFGKEVFRECTNLKSFSIPSGITAISDGLFQECTSLKNINLGNDVEQIGELAFYKCENLETIDLSTKLKYVGYSAFSNCTKLAKITIPKDVEVIKKYAFGGCTGLKEVKFAGNGLDALNSTFSNCTSLEHIELPEGLVVIGSNTFENCKALKSVYFPETLIYFQMRNDLPPAFVGCKNLEEVTVSKSNPYFTVVDKALYTKKDNVDYYYEKDDTEYHSPYSFRYNKNSLILGWGDTNIKDGTEYIASSAFEGTGIQTVTIPQSVYSIGKYAFRGTELKEVNWQNTDYCYLHDGCFADCDNLKSVSIPAGVMGSDYSYSGSDAIFANSSLIQISGYKDTWAEKYASNNNIVFVSLGEKPSSQKNYIYSDDDENSSSDKSLPSNSTDNNDNASESVAEGSSTIESFSEGSVVSSNNKKSTQKKPKNKSTKKKSNSKKKSTKKSSSKKKTTKKATKKSTKKSSSKKKTTKKKSNKKK